MRKTLLGLLWLGIGLGVGSAYGQGLSYTQKISQVLNRLSFGPKPGDEAMVRQLGLKAYIEQQLHPETIDDSQCQGDLGSYPAVSLTALELFQKYPPARAAQPGEKPNPDEVKAANEHIREILNQLTEAKWTRILESKRQLQEVMTDFWFNHFNVTFEKNRDKWLLAPYENDVIRPNALGKFSDLLKAVAHSPAMLEYLDNVNSRVDPRYVPADEMGEYPAMEKMMADPANAKKSMGLNENYARELMELHTMGVDSGYTQEDVIQVARALTGWSFQGPGKPGQEVDPAQAFQFKFRARMHDQGPATILGQVYDGAQGEAEGDAVLGALAQSPATAHFIATELCRRFVCDDPPPALVDRTAQKFLESGGDIAQTLRSIFYSKEFLGPRYYRSKIKSPLEFVASALRATNAQLTEPEKLSGFLNLMGEPLYLCEPPTGYPDNAKAWINSSALLDRMNFSLILLGNKPNSPAQVNLTALDPALSDGGDGEKILKGFFQTFLNGQVSANTRKVLYSKLKDPEVSHAILDDKQKNFEASQLGALVLGSPDFQRR
jgi:uncharacterized protein (DUF1800 family)